MPTVGHSIFNLQEVIAKKWIPEDKLQLFEDVQGVKVTQCQREAVWVQACLDRSYIPLSSEPYGHFPSTVAAVDFSQQIGLSCCRI